MFYIHIEIGISVLSFPDHRSTFHEHKFSQSKWIIAINHIYMNIYFVIGLLFHTLIWTVSALSLWMNNYAPYNNDIMLEKSLS